jgi:hypothetical protein
MRCPLKVLTTLLDGFKESETKSRRLEDRHVDALLSMPTGKLPALKVSCQPSVSKMVTNVPFRAGTAALRMDEA